MLFRSLTNARSKIPMESITEDAVPAELKGISSMNKKQLTEKAERLGINYNSNTTVAVLIARIKEHVYLSIPPMGNDTLEISKHAGLMYRTIRTQQPSFCKWVKDTLQENPGDTHWELRRFGMYLDRDLSPAVEPTVQSPVTPRTRGRKSSVQEGEIKEIRSQVREI